ncbi:MAG: ATP-binding protein [Flavipsychrobacter sp.]|nr:ATP-binding protein [Flavipsychrobacter sp.]
MKFDSVKFNNKFEEWEHERIEFFNLTLLVGVSGVGKTQILRSISLLKSIVEGKSVNGGEWEAEFTTSDGNKYTWEGAYELISSKGTLALDFLNLVDNDEKAVKPRILFEKLYQNGKLIIDRNENEIKLNNILTPKLSPHQSVLYILKEEGDVKSASDGFKMVVLRDYTEREHITFGRYNIEKLKTKYKTLDEIKESEVHTVYKLALVYENVRSVFDQIVEKFAEVFPQIEEVKVDPYKDDELPILFEAPIIQIKERGVNKWIPHNRISSGMLRTLLHISEMMLWKSGTVMLIDEFENSLGVNCIDTLTEDLVFDNPTIQFIATSHHPYIINKIPYEYWKIVTRHGGTIKTFDANQFNLGETKHERFMTLVNLPEYRNGIQ